MHGNLNIFKFLILTFIVWRLALILITFLGISILPSTTSPSKDLFWPSTNIDYWTRWADWDGGDFLSISNFGYLKLQTTFFPLYPLLIKADSLFNIPTFWSAFLISQLSTILILFFLYKLVLLDFSEKNAKKAIFSASSNSAISASIAAQTATTLASSFSAIFLTSSR